MLIRSLYLHRYMSLSNKSCRGKRILINYPRMDRLTCITLNNMNISGIQIGLLLKSLWNLRDMGFLDYKKHSRNKITIRLNERGYELIEALVELYDNLGSHNFELTFNDIKILYIINSNGFFLSASRLSRYLGISKQGCVKILKKIRKIGLIGDKGLLTCIGQKILNIFIPYIQNKESFRPAHPANSIYGSDEEMHRQSANSIRVLFEKISQVIEINQSQGYLDEKLDISILAIGSDRTFDAAYALYNSLKTTPHRIQKILLVNDPNYKKYAPIHNAHMDPNMDSDYLENLMSDSYIRKNVDLLIAILTPAMASIMQRIAERLRIKVIMITKISNYLLDLDNDIESIRVLSSQIFATIKKALNNGSEIVLSWGKKNEKSYIKIRPMEIPRDLIELTLRSSNGLLNNYSCEIPYGKITIDLKTILSFVKISGKIRVRGNPIYGLKGPYNHWPHRSCRYSYCNIRIEQKEHTHELSHEQSTIKNITKVIHGSKLESISLGLNNIINAKIENIITKAPFLLPYIRGYISLNIKPQNTNHIKYQYVGYKPTIKTSKHKIEL